MLLAGNGSLDFAEAVAVQNAEGNPLENVQVEDKYTDSQILAICTQQHAVDYDGDGDLDMVVGCFGPKFYYYENTGTKDEPALSAPVELPVQIDGYHSGPHFVDWDNDGDLDLLSGSGTGGALLSVNRGSREQPEWSEFQQLLPPSTNHEQTTAGGKSIEPSPSTRVWAYDWNRDGLLDLLVGDSANIVNPVEGLSVEEFEARKSEYEKTMEELQAAQAPLYEKMQKAMEAGEEPDEELNKQLQEASQKFSELYQTRSSFIDEQSTGFVWLYIQKPSAVAATNTATTNE